MKKLSVLLLAMIMAFSFAACGDAKDGDGMENNSPEEVTVSGITAIVPDGYTYTDKYEMLGRKNLIICKEVPDAGSVESPYVDVTISCGKRRLSDRPKQQNTIYNGNPQKRSKRIQPDNFGN